MGNALNILTGPADITLYDATDGYLNLGHNEDVKVEEKPEIEKTFNKQIRRLYSEFELEISCIQYSQNLKDQLYNREGRLQTIYIAGLNDYTVISDVYIVTYEESEFTDEPRRLIISAGFMQRDKMSHSINLLGTYGTFDNDDDSDGVANGWTAVNVQGPSLENSFLGPEYGQAQNGGFDSDYDARIYRTHDVYFRAAKRVTFSVYLKIDFAATMRLKFNVLDKDMNTVQSIEQDFSFSNDEQKRCYISAFVQPNRLIHHIQPIIKIVSGSGVLEIDNAQLEFGTLSPFKSY